MIHSQGIGDLFRIYTTAERDGVDFRGRCNERAEAWATDRQRALTWAQRRKRVFAIEIETCQRCGGRLRVIASIEAPSVIARLLEHLGRDADPAHPTRAPPQRDLLL